MKKANQASLVERLEKQGLSFRRFSLAHEGNYSAEDAEWNYTDVPHLEHVHKLVNGIDATMGDDCAGGIVLQRVLGLRLPLAFSQYQADPNSITYYAAFGFFILIIETTWNELAPLRTRVVTTYRIGGPRLLRPVFPLIQYLLTKNYGILMQDDIPMRERRGQLRAWGYKFHKNGARHSFLETCLIGRNNLIPPDGKELSVQVIKLATQLPHDGSILIGRPDHLGIRVERRGSELFVLRRTCPHEGAALDSSACVNGTVSCPWHGRPSPALARFDTTAIEPSRVVTEFHEFAFGGGELTVSFPVKKTTPKETVPLM